MSFNILEQWGCDIVGAMDRFVGNQELYLNCLHEVIREKDFELLGKALECGDNNTAFECAHNLKGELANMGLTPMLDIAVEILDPLRRSEDCDLTEPYTRLMESLEKLKELVAQI